MATEGLDTLYPAYAERIRLARADGYSDEEIQREFQSRIQEQSRSGQSVRQIQSTLGQERPSSLQRLASGPAGEFAQGSLEALAYPVEVAAGAIGGTAVPLARIGAAGLANLVAAATRQEPRAMEKRALSAVDEAAPYLQYQPQGRLARTTLEVAGAPFAAAEKGLEAAGVPEEIARPAVEVGGFVLPYLYHRFVGRAPRSAAEVEQLVREQPAIGETVKRIEENAPKDLPARIEAAKRDGFSEQEIAGQLIERAQETASKPAAKAEVSVEPGAGPEFFSTLKDLGYNEEQLRTMPLAEKVRRARERVPAETEAPIAETKPIEGETTAPKTETLEPIPETPPEKLTPETATIAPESTLERELAPEAIPAPETQPGPESVSRAAGIEGRAQQKVNEILSRPLRTDQKAVKAAADEHIRAITDTPAELEYKGKVYEGAEKVGNNVLLKDDPDKLVRGVNEILKIDEKVPFDIPPEGGSSVVAEPGLAALEKSTTSIKNAVVDQELAAQGSPPAVHGERVSFEQARAQAAERIKTDPMAGQKLVEELEAKPRAPSATEDALLLHEQTRLKNARVAVENQLIEAQKTGNPEAIAEAKRRVETATAEFSRLADVVTKVGTESALSLAHRKALMREDYSLAAMERAKQVANDGKPLSDAQRAEVKALHEKINATQKMYDDYVAKAEAQKAEAESKLAHTRMVIDVDKAVDPKVKSLADRIVIAMEREAQSARARIKEKMGRLSAGLDPTLVADMAVVGAAKLARGALEFGRWSKAMLDDLGQGIEPYLQAVWEASSKKLDDFVTKRAPRQSQEPIKRALKGGDVTERRAAILDGIRAKAKEGGDISVLAQRLARGFVEQGIKERSALIDAVHKELTAILPEMTRREAMDAISGYGKFRELAKDQVSTELRDLKGQMQQVAKLEDIESRVPPKKTGVEQRTPSDEERRLIQNVNEAKRRFGVVQTDPARQLKTALDQVKARLRNSISDLEYQIANRQKIVREKTATPLDQEATELRARRDELKKEFSEVFGKPGMTEAQRLQAYKTATARRTAELERRIETGDFAPRTRSELQLDEQGKRLQFENVEAKRRWNEALLNDQLANRTVPQRILGGVGEVLNTSRALLTSLDLSAVLRQGGFIGLGHPVRAARAMPDMFRALRSKQGEHAVLTEIQNRPNYPLYKKSKLYLAEPGTTLAQMEEAYMSRWAEKVPLVGASQRAYTSFLNRLRADSFDTMVNTLTRDGKPTPAEASAIANYVNVATGRGNLGQNASALVGLNTVFFAPRYAASRFQLLAGQPLYGGTARTRGMIAKEYARYLTGIASVYALAKLSGAEIETDPRSSDFGKLRFGQTRIDPLSGLAQATTLLGRLATGETKRLSGKVVPIRGEKVPYGGDDSADVIARFLRTKLAPVPGAAVDIAAGKNVVGEKVTPGSVATNAAVPLAFRDIYEAMVDQGVPRGTALGILSIFGFGLQTYEPRQAAGGGR